MSWVCGIGYEASCLVVLVLVIKLVPPGDDLDGGQE